VFEDYTFEADTDPHTSAAWTAANVNAYEFGYYATFTSAPASETLQPTGDGTDAEWDLTTGSAYYSILSDNADSGTPNTWTDYIYTNVNSESAGITFGPTTSTFSTITSIEPKVWAYTFLGSRILNLTVDDGANDKLFKKTALVDPPMGNRMYEDYIAEDHIPEQLTWTNTTQYGIDPTTGTAWDPATAFTYDWNLKTNAAEKAGTFQVHSGPSAFTSAPDWRMWHESQIADGSVETSNLAGTLYGKIYYNSPGAYYYVDLRGTLTGAWAGIMYSDNLTLTSSGTTGVWVEGRLTGSTPGSLAGNLSPTKPPARPGRNNRGHLVFTDNTDDIEGVIDPSGTIPVTATGGVLHGMVYAAITGESATATFQVMWEYIGDQTIWDTDWISEDIYFGKPFEPAGGPYALCRDRYYEGTYPVSLAMDDVPAAVNVKNIPSTGMMLAASIRTYADSPTFTMGFTETQPTALGIPLNTNVVKKIWGIAGPGATTETKVNADVFKLIATGSAYTYDLFQIYALNQWVRFTPYPEMRVYRFELEVTGTTGPQPAVSQFNITVEGATATDRRQSRLLVSQTDFYRCNKDSTTLVDISGSATAPTGNRTDRWDTTKFYSKQYFTNGINGIYRYPDASDEVEDLNGGSPIAHTIASYIGRLFAGSTTETGTFFGDRVRWSAVGDDSDWTGTGSGYLDLDDTDGTVVKLLPLGGVLVAYKDTSLYNLHATGDRDDAVVKQLLSPGIGAAAMSTVKSIVGRDGLPAHLFLGQGHGGYNVYLYTGNLLTPIGDPIRDELRDNLNPHQAKNAFAVVDQKRNQYMFFVCYERETFPTRAWLYDINTGAWKHWVVPQVTCAGQLEAKEELSTSYTWTTFLGRGDSLSRWMDPDLYEDTGAAAIWLVATSGDWAVKKRENYATLYRLHIYYYDRGYTPIFVRASSDGGDTYSDTETVYIGQEDDSADGSLRVAHVDLMVTGKRFRTQIVHATNDNIALSEIQMEIEEQGWIV